MDTARIGKPMSWVFGVALINHVGNLTSRLRDAGSISRDIVSFKHVHGELHGFSALLTVEILKGTTQLFLLKMIKERVQLTRPSRPIRCDEWIVERMRYRPTDGHSQL